MRKTLAVAVLLGAVGLTAWGQDEPPPARYGVPPNLDLFPQDSPKAALSSAVKAVEKGRTDYLAAHLIDPKFIDDRVADRAKAIEKAAAADLRALREAQAQNPDAAPREDRVPADPKGFDEAVRREAARRAFRLVAQDIRGTLDENPDHLKDLRRFLREGQITDAGDTASAALRDARDRSVHFRKVGNRWYVQDRKRAEPADGKK
jgi:hypothetical protein